MKARNIRVRKREITPTSECRSKKWEVVYDGYYADGTQYCKDSRQYATTKIEAEGIADFMKRHGV